MGAIIAPMETVPLTLASASPRRRRLVGWLGVPVAITATDTPEDLDRPVAPDVLATELALDKAHAAREAGATGIVLAFDTIVVLGTQLLGKPVDEAEARLMLRALSGGTHEVLTGVAVLTPDARPPQSFAVRTPVQMRSLSDQAIEAWIAEGECLGCAGAYNIERHLARVDDDQCFHNVTGIPLCHVYRALAALPDGALPGLTCPVGACDAALGRTCALGPQLCGAGS
jgi:septum formation protein